MFGDDETTLIAPAIAACRAAGIDASGPYPPDTVFYRAYRGGFDVVVAMTHDHGLIPLKLVHFEDGVNVTMGLPIVRTSVDHGTAYDIAGKGTANPASLLDFATAVLHPLLPVTWAADAFHACIEGTTAGLAPGVILLAGSLVVALLVTLAMAFGPSTMTLPVSATGCFGSMARAFSKHPLAFMSSPFFNQASPA